MQYVTFCAAPSVGTAEWKTWEILSGQKQFELFRKSVLRFDKEATFVILTDFKTQFDNIRSDTKIVRSEINQREIMLERTRRQLAFLEQDDGSSPILFADTDMLILAPLQQVFSSPFDVAVTIRKHEKMPINGGIFFVHNQKLERGICFFKEILNRMAAETKTERREWYGDQIALAEILDPLEFPQDIGNLREYKNYSVKLLDAQKYNFSPEEDRPILGEDLSGKLIYHFKGRCRSYMASYWKLRLNDEASWILRLPFSMIFYQAWLDFRRHNQKSIIHQDIRRKFKR